MNRNPFSNPTFGSIGRRIKRKRDVIVTDDGRELEFLVEEESEFDPQGDFYTAQTIYSKIMPDGWKVSSQHVVAQCYKCGSFVSLRAVRNCRCGKVMCARDAKYWEDENERRFVCHECYKSLRRKKLLKFAGSLLLSPFIQKKEA